MQNDLYIRINTEDYGENEQKNLSGKKKKFKRNKKLKEKILYKYLILKLSFTKIFFISVILSFLVFGFLKYLFILNNNSINYFSKAMQNIIEQQKTYNNNKIENNSQNTKVIIQENFDSRELSFNKSYEFLKMNMEGKLIQDKSKFISLENPKASAVIPVYNSRNFISRAVKSIQNQNLLELEIILVNDFSTDDTLPYIENIQKEDPRIKIIKNQKNMGILYSRSIGSLFAKGEYIFPLDNDDMFLNADVFSVVTNMADIQNIDLLEFKAISVSNEKNPLKGKISDRVFSDHKLNYIMTQPELGDYPLRAGTKIGDLIFQDVYLWSKSIRSKIYREALNNIGKERYSRFMIGHEDVVVNFILFNTAKSFKFIGKYGIFRVYRKQSANKQTNDINQNLKQLYLADIALIYLKNSNERIKLIYHLIYNVLNLKMLRNILNLSQYNRQLFKSCLDRFLNCPFIPNEYKVEIRKKGKRLSYTNYPF